MFSALCSLFGCQGDDRVHPGCLAGRQKAEHQTGEKRRRECHNCRHGREDHIHAEGLRRQTGAYSNDNPDDPADAAYHERLGIELQENMGCAGAGCHPYADLAGTLGNGHQHDVHDADAADQERNCCH